MSQENVPTVCVVGSINMDLTIATEKMPIQGETVIEGEFATHYGGKGANQAVAAARMGIQVEMIGAVGKDAFGSELLAHLKAEGIGTEGIQTVTDEATGIANIILSENDNRIIVASGANLSVTASWVKQHEEIIKQSDFLLLQLEIPLEAVVYTLRVATENNVPVILNPAPYQPLPEAVVSGVTFLTPNEIELAAMKQDINREIDTQKLIVTRGDHGIQYEQDGKINTVASHPVHVVDTTGAGDTFNGVLAAMLAKEAPLPTAVEFANAAAGQSVMKIGAQEGMPTLMEVEHFLEKGPIISEEVRHFEP